MHMHAVLAVVRDIPRLAEVELPGDHSVMVVELLQALVVLHHDLDVARRDGHALVLDQSKGLVVLTVEGQPQRQVRRTLRRTVHDLQRREQVEHAERHFHPLRQPLEETPRRLVAFALKRDSGESPVLLHDGIRHRPRRDPHRLEPFAERHLLGCVLRRRRRRVRRTAIFGAHEADNLAPVALAHFRKYQIIHYYFLSQKHSNLRANTETQKRQEKRPGSA